MARGRASRSPSIAIVAILGIAVVVVALVVTAVASSLGGSHGPSTTSEGNQAAALRHDRAALLAWEADVVPLVQQGGQVVQDGMKPAVQDLLYQHVTPPAFIVHEARAWAQALARVRARLAALTAPTSMRSAALLLDRSLVGYISAAHAFRLAAASPPGHARHHYVRLGQRRGDAADAVYDRAATLIQHERQRVGLPADINFPSAQS